MTTKSVFYIYAICITLTFTALKFSENIEEEIKTILIQSSKKRMKETFYISHGSPTLSIDDSLPARGFLQSFQEKVFSPKPKAILVISGHWETAEPTVNAVVGPSRTIYDFYGFPERMYRLKYPAPGSPELAQKVKRLLNQSGFKRVDVDEHRGLDHGAWVPLMLMYPDAAVPVVQLSVQPGKDARHHYEVGKALRSLKDDGVLVVGSGAATHNLRLVRRDLKGDQVEGWAYAFDNWIKEAIEEGRYEDVIEYEKKAPHARKAHPSPEHFYPLHVAMGAAEEGSKGEIVHRSWSNGTLSYSSYKFGGE